MKNRLLDAEMNERKKRKHDFIFNSILIVSTSYTKKARKNIKKKI